MHVMPAKRFRVSFFVALCLGAYASQSTSGQCPSLLQRSADGFSLALSEVDRSEARSAEDFDIVVLDFRYASMGHNNLGGKGPDPSPELMLFKNITLYKGQSLDLEVKALSSYSGNVSKNMISGSFGQINVAPGTSIDLSFTFRDGATMEDVEMPAFTFSFWDLDKGKDGGIESMSIGPILSYFTTENTEVVSSEVSPGYWNFTATTRGNYADNPTDVDSLTERQMNRAVELAMAMTSTFNCTYKATANTHGRTFLFGGHSKLYFETPPTPVGPCANLTRLDLSSCRYLGGSLPQPGLRWGGVTQKNGKPVDLLVTADSSYAAKNASRNGVLGSVININVLGNVTTDITFKFIDSEGNPVELSRFYLTFLDFDGPKNGWERAVFKNTFAEYYLSVDSSVSVQRETEQTTFQSTRVGYLADNANKADPLTDFQKSVAFSLFFEKETSEVTVTFSSENIKRGRNFQVASGTSLPCP